MDRAPQLRVAVLYGGCSAEREVSLLTGRRVLEALRQADPQRLLHALDVRIEASGQWIVEGSAPAAPVRALEALCGAAGADVAFLALHGGEGEDGTLQGLLASHGLRHTGSGVAASALCMDKHALRLVAQEAGLRVPPGFSVSPRTWSETRGAVLDRALGLGDSGWFVKPRRGGSSVATSAVEDAARLPAALELTLATGEDALVEGWVRGVEVSCGLLGDHDGELEALMPIEIQPAQGTFFDYQQKYDSQHGARERCPPTSLDDAACNLVQAHAQRAHRLAGCRGYSRVDFIYPTPSDPGTAPILLEINTLPGLTPRSLLPQEAEHAGLGYRELVLSIIDRALAREPLP